MAESARSPKQPKPATPERLEKSGLAYLARFATSAAHLRGVLLRKVKRSADLHGTDPAEGARAVDVLVTRWCQAGLVDDQVFAEGKTASLRRRGVPARRIAEKLSQKGIDRDLAAQVLDAHDEENGGDLAAAATLARRRRLGPYRREEADTAARLKELSVFARAGFGRGIAQAIIDARSVEALEALLDDRD